MTAGSGPNDYRSKADKAEKADKPKRTPLDPRKAWLIMGAVFFMVIGIAIAAEPSPNTAQCFDLAAYQNSHDDHADHGAYQFATGQVGSGSDGIPHDPCPDGYAPRQACAITDANDPANNTGDCGWNEKPHYWTDADLQYTVEGTAPDLSTPVNGMPRDVFLTVCADPGSGADEGQPVKTVRTDGPFKDHSYLYEVKCSNGATVYTEY